MRATFLGASLVVHRYEREADAAAAALRAEHTSGRLVTRDLEILDPGPEIAGPPGS